MLELIVEMNAAERAKRELPYGSPEFRERAIEVERIARIGFRWSHPGSDDGQLAADDVERLREEYQVAADSKARGRRCPERPAASRPRSFILPIDRARGLRSV